MKEGWSGWLWAASAVCLLGWLLFVVNLDTESLWYDEWYTWEISRQGLLGSVNTTATDVHPPFYYLWVVGWMGWTQSDDVFLMRLSSVIPAVLAVAMCYRVGSDWFGSRWVGLVAAVFLATSGIFIYYARELRMYSLIVLLGLGSWWLLWRYLKGHNRSLIGYAVTVALMMYTYYFTAFMIVVQALVGLIFAPRRIGRLLLAYGAALIAFAVWLPTLYQQLVLESSRAGRGDALTLTSIGKFAANQPTNSQTVQEFIQTYTAQQPAFVILLLALAVLAAVRSRAVIVTALWLLGTTLLFFGVNLVIPVYNLRYVLMVVPALALLIGVGLASLQLSARAMSVLVVLVAVLGITAHTSAFLPPKAPHRQLMHTLSANYRPGDRIWYNIDPGALGSTLDFERAYYLQHAAPNLNTDLFIWDAPNDFANATRVWDVRPYWVTMPNNVSETLLSGWSLSEEYPFGAYTVRLYETPPADQTPITFDDLLSLKISESSKTVFRPGDTVTVKTWWHSMETVPLDYSYGLYLRGADGAVLAQNDHGLEIDGKPTSQWTTEDSLAKLQMTLPANLSPGDYSLWLAVYYWEDPQPLSATASDEFPTDNNVVRVATIRVE